MCVKVTQPSRAAGIILLVWVSVENFGAAVNAVLEPFYTVRITMTVETLNGLNWFGMEILKMMLRFQFQTTNTGVSLKKFVD